MNPIILFYDFMDTKYQMVPSITWICHVTYRGVAMGGISIYIPPKSVHLKFLWGTFSSYMSGYS